MHRSVKIGKVDTFFQEYFCDICGEKFKVDYPNHDIGHICEICGKETCKECRDFLTYDEENSWGPQGMKVCMECIKDPSDDLMEFLKRYAEFWHAYDRQYDLEDEMRNLHKKMIGGEWKKRR